jgi:hypothetical protein
MKNDYLRGELSQAIAEQQWKYAVMNVFNNFGGGQVCLPSCFVACDVLIATHVSRVPR